MYRNSHFVAQLTKIDKTCLKHPNPNHFIFGHKLDTNKTNIPCDFGENPTRWRHFLTSNVIFLYISIHLTSSEQSADVSTYMTSHQMFYNFLNPTQAGGVKMTHTTIFSYTASKIHIDGLPNFLTFPKMVRGKFWKKKFFRPVTRMTSRDVGWRHKKIEFSKYPSNTIMWPLVG